MKRAALLVLAMMVVPGCLSRSHVIPKNDLIALSQQAPDQRGQRVRVIQGFASEDDPPEARGSGGGTVVIVGGGGHSHGGGRHNSSAPARRSPSTAKGNADKAYVWIIIAAAVAITAAATEGARYDGWVELAPQHPVHLWGPYNEYTWVPLNELDPQTAMWARKAIVRPGEGSFRHLGRAPLNRRGFAYGMTLGRTESPSIYGYDKVGFLSHIQLGVFFTQQVGLFLDFGLGWATNDLGGTIFEDRNALELQILPLSAGAFHGGVYGQVGIGLRQEDGPKDGVELRDTYIAGGGMLQLELTTRLTITGRAGITNIFGSTVSDIGVGLSIY
jgi:hypothetical protein